VGGEGETYRRNNGDRVDEARVKIPQHHKPNLFILEEEEVKG
jgi:hypothetical protein